MRKAIIIPGFLVLAACGGGGGTAVNPQFEAQKAQLDILCSEYNCNDLSFTDYTNAIAVNSNVTYTGVVLYAPGLDEPPARVRATALTSSEIVLSVDFADTTTRPVTGSLSNFQARNAGVEYSGSLEVTGTFGSSLDLETFGKAGIKGATVSGLLDVTTPDESGQIFYNGEFDALFVGQNAEGVFGDGGLNDGTDDISFTFLAERPLSAP